jgi:cobalt-zinc-cadmium efflux system outer membrane protein
VQQRPEVAVERSAAAMRRGELDAAHAAARWPSFTLGAEYMFMPLASERHNYGVTLGLSLPWLSSRYSDEVSAAEANLAAQRSALSGAELSARYELYEALSNLQAARESLAIIERDLLPRAEQSYESAEAAYRGGGADSLVMLEALQSVLDVRVERERVIARLEVALAELERALGTHDAKPSVSGRDTR